MNKIFFVYFIMHCSDEEWDEEADNPEFKSYLTICKNEGELADLIRNYNKELFELCNICPQEVTDVVPNNFFTKNDGMEKGFKGYFGFN